MKNPFIYKKWQEELKLKDAIIIQSRDIHIAHWVNLKCRYGCGEYLKKLSCPPYPPDSMSAGKILAEYKTALLIHDQASWKIRWAVTEIEKKAVEMGYFKAFGLGSGPCQLCDNCEDHDTCPRTGEARPSMEALGIDVFTTVKKFGYELEGKCDTPSFFGLVLIE